MGKRWSRRRISHASRAKRGLGKGTGKNYKPYIGIRDVFSRGLSTLVPGWTTGRQHDLFSKLELAYFLLLDWCDSVIDIREQYPLPTEETRQVASWLRIKHPYDTRHREHITMTTDFLFTQIVDGVAIHVPRDIKYSKELEGKRTRDKFKIVELYWDGLSKEGYAPWKVVTEKEIPWDTVNIILWVHPYRNFTRLGLPADTVAEIASDISARVTDSDDSLAALGGVCDARHGVELGTSLLVARHLLARKIWRIDMRSPFDPGVATRVMVTSSDVAAEVLRGL